MAFGAFGNDKSLRAHATLSAPEFPEAAPSPEHEEMVALVRRALQKDATAFERIVARYERRIMTLAIRLLGSRDDAQDAAQDVFLRAFKYLHRLDLDKPLEPWLVRMTVNVCRDIGRKRRRQHLTFPATTGTEAAVVDPSAGPHEGLDGDQQRTMLRRALDTLPEKERQAIVLRDVEGLSTAEVAVILGSSETTVRSQISRGRLRMKEAIDRMTGGRP